MLVEQGPIDYKSTSFRERIIFPETSPIEVYDFRDLDHQEDVAKAIAAKAQLAMFAGVWAGFKAVDAHVEEEPYFYVAKPGRPKEAKIVVMMSPEKSHELTDWEKVHEDFRYLEDYDEYAKLWSTHGAALHVITPVKTDTHFPKLFLTTPEEYAQRYQGHQPIAHSTVSFFWRDDPYLENLMRRVDEHSEKPMFIGGTSLNRHGEAPPFTYEDFQNHLNERKADPSEIHLVVRDSIEENSEAHGSHTQIWIPHEDEEPIVRIYRIGTLSPEGFAGATGMPIRIMDDAKDVRRYPGVNIDDRIRITHQQIKSNWSSVSVK
jgi:hypothetical protein